MNYFCSWKNDICLFFFSRQSNLFRNRLISIVSKPIYFAVELFLLLKLTSKIFGWKKFVNKFLSKTFVKKILGKKNLGQQIFWVKKFLGQNNFLVKKFLVKKFLGQRNFWVKKLEVRKNWGSKKIMVKKILVKKIFG